MLAYTTQNVAEFTDHRLKDSATYLQQRIEYLSITIDPRFQDISIYRWFFFEDYRLYSQNGL